MLKVTFIISILLISGAVLATQPEGRCRDKSLSLQVLGSGGPEFYAERAATSYLLWHRGKARLLIDAGAGSLTRFAQAGADFEDLRAILLTHLHVDHSVDLAAYIKAGYFSQRNEDLPVLGPTGNRLIPSTSDYLQGLIGNSSNVYRYLDDFLEPGEAAFHFVPREVNVAKHRIQQPGNFPELQIAAVPVHHGPVPALAWRIDVADKRIVISGDMNGDYGTLAQLARGADLLIAHHAIPQGAGGVARKLHMPPSVIGRIAAQAEVKQLVLSHRMHRTLGREVQSMENIRQHYSGPVTFAEDLVCFSW